MAQVFIDGNDVPSASESPCAQLASAITQDLLHSDSPSATQSKSNALASTLAEASSILVEALPVEEAVELAQAVTATIVTPIAAGVNAALRSIDTGGVTSVSEPPVETLSMFSHLLGQGDSVQSGAREVEHILSDFTPSSSAQAEVASSEGPMPPTPHLSPIPLPRVEGLDARAENGTNPSPFPTISSVVRSLPEFSSLGYRTNLGTHSSHDMTGGYDEDTGFPSSSSSSTILYPSALGLLPPLDEDLDHLHQLPRVPRSAEIQLPFAAADAVDIPGPEVEILELVLAQTFVFIATCIWFW